MIVSRTPFASLALVLVLAGAAPALAETPPIFPVQGVLTDADGALIDGSVTVLFALYDASDAAAPVWEETRSLDVAAGLLTAYLGETEDLPPSLFASHSALWLGITVEDDEEMERVELGSSAFAAVAQHALDVPEDVARGGQSCSPGDVVAGLDALGDVVCVPDADEDTLYSGADFALADQLCLSGEVVLGIDAAGQAVCVVDTDTDTDTQYTGTTFATSAQQCSTGNVVFGIDVNGGVICVADDNNTYSGVDFALAGQFCADDDIAIGFDSSGVLQCTSTVPWGLLTGIPGDLADGDQDTDTLADLPCDPGEMAVLDPTSGEWACVDHAGDPDAHHSETSDGLAVTPASVTIQGTSTALTDGELDLGPDADDALTGAMVTTLTGGGLADSLHTHAGTGNDAPTVMTDQTPTTYTFGAAARYCRDLVQDTFDDWRVPTYEEAWCVYQATTVPSPTSSSWFWTSSADPGSGYQMLIIRFSDGYPNAATGSSVHRVRCVR
ncbi:MAG: DUF1566 domain-containing protein [Proteobacteria bacterium]|nr:DUF1566 domain-containing protein [Pseudomonadota bacterium]